MKKMSALLVFIFILVAGAAKAHALLLQGPNGLYFPHLPVLGRPVDVLPTSIMVRKEIYRQKVVHKKEYVEDVPPVGADILIESYPVKLQKG